MFSAFRGLGEMLKSRQETPCDVGSVACCRGDPSWPTNVISSRPSLLANMFGQSEIAPDTTTQEKEPDLSDDFFSLERVDPSLELGSLYDVTSRTVIPGLKMWTPEVIEKERRVKALGHTHVEYKAAKFKEDAHGTLTSFDTSLMETCGASEYINRFCNTSNYQYVTLIYKCVKRSEELQVNHLVREPASAPPSRGSHIVTQINYADYAVFLLDVTSPSFSEAQQNRGRLEEAARALMRGRDPASTVLESATAPLGSTSPTLDSASTAYGSISPMPGLTSEYGLTSPSVCSTSTEYGPTSPTVCWTSPEYDPNLNDCCSTSGKQQGTTPPPPKGGKGEESSSSSNIRFRVFRSDRISQGVKEVAMSFQEALDTFRRLPRDFTESGSPGVPVSAFLYKTNMFTKD